MRLFGFLAIEVSESLEHDRGDVGNFEKHLVEKYLGVCWLLRAVVMWWSPLSDFEDLD